MENIIIEPYEVWEYYEDHAKELVKCKHLMAENKDFGVKVWITIEDFELVIIVEEDESEIYRDFITSEDDSSDVACLILESYVMSDAIEKFLEDTKEETEEEDILFRESDLDIAVIDFMSTVCEEDFSKRQDIVDDVKEHFLEYLARKWNASIYRPMYLHDMDTNEEYFSEYPYEDLVFEDEGNPIYKK